MSLSQEVSTMMTLLLEMPTSKMGPQAVPNTIIHTMIGMKSLRIEYIILCKDSFFLKKKYLCNVFFMERKDPQHISVLLSQFLQQSNLGVPLLERQLMRHWEEVVGHFATRYTTQLEIKEGVLYAHISNAALRNELFNMRFDIVKKLNATVGSRVLHDIRLFV